MGSMQWANLLMRWPWKVELKNHVMAWPGAETMNPRRCKIAEQEWRESWEPVLPLIAPGERMDTPVDHAWTEAGASLGLRHSTSRLDRQPQGGRHCHLRRRPIG